MDIYEVENMNKQVLLCINSYEEKYYINQEFSGIPEKVIRELLEIASDFIQEIGGVLTISFLQEGSISLETVGKETDYHYDEIGGQLKIKELQNTKKDLWNSLTLWYKLLYQGKQK